MLINAGPPVINESSSDLKVAMLAMPSTLYLTLTIDFGTAYLGVPNFYLQNVDIL